MTDQPRRRSRRAVAPVTDPSTAVGGPEHGGDSPGADRGSRCATLLEDDSARPGVTLEKQSTSTPVATRATEPIARTTRTSATERSAKTSPAALTGPAGKTGPMTKTSSATKTSPATATSPTGEAATGAEAPAADAGSVPPRRRSGRRLPVLALVLVLVGALALAGAVGFGVRAHQLRSTDAARNLALVDTPLTNEVVGQVSAALNQVFSYDYQHPETTQKAASTLLVGDASGQYKVLFDALQTKATGQQLTLTTKTLLGGVSALTPTSARLLVFLDQTSTRVSDKSSSTAAAQLDVAAVKQGSVWKISEIRPL